MSEQDDKVADTTVANPSTEEDVKDNLEDFDDVDWSEGEEVPDKFSGPKKDDSAATDSDDQDQEEKSKEDESAEEKTKESESEDDKSEEEKTEEESTEDDKTSDDGTSSEDDRKRHNDEMAKERIARKKAEAEAATVRREKQESDIEKYLEEAGDDEIEREKREVNVQAFRVREEKIELNQQRIETGIDKALSTIDLFKSGNKDIQEELAASLDVFEAMFIEKDKLGRPGEIKIDPKTGKPADVYQYLQAKAESIKRLTGVGARQQEKQKGAEKSRTVTTPVRAPKAPKVDADVEAFDEEAARY